MEVLVLFIMIISLLLIGVPIAVSLGLSSMIFLLVMSDTSLESIAQSLYQAMAGHYTLLAIPFFILASSFMSTGGVAQRIIRFAIACVGHLQGGLAIAGVMACMIFAALSGSSPATVVAIGSIVIAAMTQAGYSKEFAAGVICNAGTLGILIPPSIMLIVYAATAGVSVVKLYAAAMVPGMLLAGLYLVYVIGRVVINPKLAPKPKDVDDVGFFKAVQLLVTAFLPLAALIMTVLGSILFGLATPSEAAAMGSLGGMVLAVVYRAMTWQRLKEAVFLTAKTTAMVCYLFVGSWTFSSVFSYLGGESVVKDFMLSMDLSTVQFLLLTQLIIFILGWPLEWSEIIIIFVPIFLPLLEHFNVDPMLFGILIAINLQTSFLTPPMAMSAYYLKGIAPKEVELWTIFKGCFPFLGMVFVTIALVYVQPKIVTWLPDLMYDSKHTIEDVTPSADEEGSVMDPAFLMGGGSDKKE